MGDDDRLANAKTAAGTLVRQLLPSGNTTNRVGVVSFASNSEIDSRIVMIQFLPRSIG